MLSRWIERFQSLPTPLFVLHVFAKFLGGVGIGMMIAGYGGGDWTWTGGWVLAASFLFGIPGALRILGKKRPVT